VRAPGSKSIYCQQQIMDVRAVRALAARCLSINRGGREEKAARRELELIDRSYRFTNAAEPIFQQLLAQLGMATVRPILLPIDDQPFWHRIPHPLANHQTTPHLPRTADIVVIGAGLTGAAAAYHLRDSGMKVVVLDRGDPAGEASGRNGGNFELLPENAVGTYEGLAPGRLSFMRKRYPRVPKEVLQAVSERQASLVLGLALRNRNIFKQTILDEGITCDFAQKGWLHIAASESEEQGLCDEVPLAAQQGQRLELWSRAKIRTELGLDAAYLGRFIPGDGTYHPFKFVCGELQIALRAGVALYTRTKVLRIVSQRTGWHQVTTDRGTIVCRALVVATNAFTRDLLPELEAIEPYQSQIFVTEHVRDLARGRIVTSEEGPVFFNQPREGVHDGCGPLVLGGGDDRPMRNPSSRRRSPGVHAHLLELRNSFYPELAGRPPSAEWIGPMAFTPDGLPCIGFLRPGVVVAAGYNGYGGSYATAAGNAAAEMAVTSVTPEWIPEEIFSPRRFLSDGPLFLTERKGLWQIANSLCDQLRSVNQRISDALTLQKVAPFAAASSKRLVLKGRSRPATNVDPKALQAFDAFSGYSLKELYQLLRYMRRWDVSRDTVIFTAGSKGASCFLVLAGSVDVSITAHGGQQLLATLPPGSVFGQVSAISGAPRSATCSAREQTILLEIARGPCKDLLSRGSGLGLKFLATLNEGLIAALRGADIRLLQLDPPIGAARATGRRA
jgi:glycine/D-amino acid oxidase-like deaminating enzyme